MQSTIQSQTSTDIQPLTVDCSKEWHALDIQNFVYKFNQLKEH